MNLPNYAELHCLSNFSFLRGASKPSELIERAKALGYSALALTDECSFAGVVRAYKAAKAANFKLIIGSEFVFDDGLKLVLLAQNRAGYGNLAALITLARRRSEKGQYRLTRGDIDVLPSLTAPSGAVPDCLALWLPNLAPSVGAGDTPLNSRIGQWLAARFPNRLWLAVELHAAGANDDRARLQQLLVLAHACDLPAVASGDAHMHARGRRALQDTLTAIRLKTTVFKAGHQLFPNGERHLRSRLRLSRLYPPALLEESINIANRCDFSLDELRYEYPNDIAPHGQTMAAFLREEVERGLRKRYPKSLPDSVRERIEHEMTLIVELNYEAYFLTVYDIVCFARSREILCQGRGSAANSAVCYALGITEVDPARSQLLFERFISRERGEPPDIDVDFEHERREEVIQYLYTKYGRDRAALTAALNTWHTRGALRDVGRVLGFGRAQIDALASSMAWWDQREKLPERLKSVGLDPAAPRVAKWLALTDALRGFPRHLSQHVGGFVISRGALSRLVPIENAAMVDRSVIQWDKDDLDTLGLLKVDVLALGMLSAIRRALALVAKQRGQPFGLADVPAEDPKVYEMICRAETVGVFQIESRAQMSMLPRLKPQNFYDLVIEVALVRPGPIQGDMVHPYLRRRRGQEAVTYPSEAVRSVLERTLGVPIFQEQVMQLAIVAAGFTAGEADQLRRSMAAWRREGNLGPFEQKLKDGMQARGYADEFAQRIVAQIRGFGEYGFPESHAASFALLVYASAWLKCHAPAAFLCALLNSQPMGFYTPSQLVQDAKRSGVEVLPVDVQSSDVDARLDDLSDSPVGAGVESRLSTAEPLHRREAVLRETPVSPPSVRLGLSTIRGFPKAVAERIVTARQSGPFLDITDLAARAALSRAELDCLAAADALRGLAGHRRQAAWEAAAAPVQLDLLSGIHIAEAPNQLPAPREGQDIAADYITQGLSLRRHPLALLRKRLSAARFVSAADLQHASDRQLIRAAGIVTCRQRPGTASGVVFVTLEDESGMTNVIVHGHLAERQRRELLSSKLLGVFGQLQREGEVVHLIAGRLVNLSNWLGELQTTSRNFH
ncbi:MAG: error-prone DNA polymerase [Rhodocyclaceae bacterium]|nr:error-prone DNA polymerase [Rhodocyclaceae bacterium]